MNLDNFFHKAIKNCFYLLFIIVPLILTPWNYELFEFNKMLTVYALTAVIVGAWVGRMILQRRIIFKRTPFDIPLLLFFISQFLSFLVSIDRHTSFFGYYSRFHGGLLSTICYLLLYWAFVSNFSHLRGDFVRNCLKVILGTAALVSFYGIAEHFGIDAQFWVQDVKNRVFSTLGQPNWLAAYLAVLIPITISFSLNENKKKFSFKTIIHCSLFIILTLCFFYTKSQSGFLGLGVSLAVFWFLIFLQNFRQKFFPLKQLFFWFLILNSCFLLLFSAVGVNAYPQIANFFNKFGIIKQPSPQSEVSTQPSAAYYEVSSPAYYEVSSSAYTPPALELGGSASSEIRKIVWKGAINIWKHYPLFGSGVETFAYSYYNFRPIEHNFVSEWDFLYNKAHNEYLNFLATTGIVGLGSYLLLIGWFIFWGVNTLIKANEKRMNTNKQIFAYSRQFAKIRSDSRVITIKSDNTPILITSLLSGYVSILITNFFGFSVVAVALFFFLIPAFCVVLAEPQEQKQLAISNYQLTIYQKLSLIILLLFTFYILHFTLNLWRADLHYANGEKYNKSKRQDLAFGELMKAIDLNGGEPVYRNEIAESAAYLALYSFQQNEATSASKLIQVALSQAEEALKVSPRNLNFRKGQVKVLYSLSQIDKSLAPLVTEALLETIKLAPTDPKLLYNLGVIYGSYNEPEQAIKSFKEAADLRPNYYDARYALAIYLKESNKKEEAREQLEYILKNIAPGDSPSAKLLKELQ